MSGNEKAPGIAQDPIHSLLRRSPSRSVRPRAAAAGKAPALPNGASSLQEAYQDWSLACRSSPKTACAILQQQTQQKRRLVLAVELQTGGGNTLSGTLLLPFGLHLDAGVTLRIDDAAALGPLRFSTCLPAGCLVPLSFDAKTVAALRAGSALRVRAESADARQLTFSISLKGFAAALQRLKALWGQLGPCRPAGGFRPQNKPIPPPPVSVAPRGVTPKCGTHAPGCSTRRWHPSGRFSLLSRKCRHWTRAACRRRQFSAGDRAPCDPAAAVQAARAAANSLIGERKENDGGDHRWQAPGCRSDAQASAPSWPGFQGGPGSPSSWSATIPPVISMSEARPARLPRSACTARSAPSPRRHRRPRSSPRSRPSMHATISTAF